MKLHILGICGTFMGGLAALAREQGDSVGGSDTNVYPPMSTQLEALGIILASGYSADHIDADCDQVIVGNALSRGNAAVEHVLNQQLNYTSGAQWLAERVLPGRCVLGVAGTHGKTTTSALLAHIIEVCGGEPGFLIGGVPGNFPVSARRGKGACFVVEADEYDTAFFDKRSKFVHYRPQIAILNNLEFDHADIFADLAAIKTQFHHLIRCVPGNGRLIVNGEDSALADVLTMGCWTPVERFAIDPNVEAEWRAELMSADGSAFRVTHAGKSIGEARWPMLGRHSVMNALAAVAAASAAGFTPTDAVAALASFRSPKRRMELLANHADIRVFDDFAHHPTAIQTTLAGLRADGKRRVIVAIEPRSNSMRLGAHSAQLAPSLSDADLVIFLRRPELPWDADGVVGALHGHGIAVATVDALLDELNAHVVPGDDVVFMSNGGFEGAPARFANVITARA